MIVNNSMFHCSNSLEGGTVEHRLRILNGDNNKIGTPTLKTLALKVLGQNKARNEYGTLPNCYVPSTNMVWNIGDYSYLYHETAGIYEFEYGMNKQKAGHQAINEVVILYSKNNHLDIGSKQTNVFINQFIKEVKYGESRESS